ERVDRLRLVIPLEHGLDAGQLVALVLLYRADRSEARQLELARRSGVPRREVTHEVPGDGHRDVVVARGPEPHLAFRAVDQEHVEVLVDPPDVRDRDPERLERAVHLGLTGEAHERADAATAAPLQEQAPDGATSIHVARLDIDREPAAAAARDLGE